VGVIFLGFFLRNWIWSLIKSAQRTTPWIFDHVTSSTPTHHRLQPISRSINKKVATTETILEWWERGQDSSRAVPDLIKRVLALASSWSRWLKWQKWSFLRPHGSSANLWWLHYCKGEAMVKNIFPLYVCTQPPSIFSSLVLRWLTYLGITLATCYRQLSTCSNWTASDAT
jgi:hypothetical protein